MGGEFFLHTCYSIFTQLIQMKEKYHINRFVLIGNGFDLSLGVKTKYSDFILWLVKKSIYESIEKGQLITPFFHLSYTRNLPGDWKSIVDSSNSIKNIISYLHQHLPFTNRSNFFDFLLTIENNWINIEQLYFDLLKQDFLNYRKSFYIVGQIESISLLNEQMEFLQLKLEEYLFEIQNYQIPKSTDFKPFINQMTQLLDNEEYYHLHGPIDSSINRYLETYFINFNYTDFLSRIPGINPYRSIIHIHGKIGDKDNPIIFGYGDDMNETYQQIELESSNEFLEHIKSFRYLQNTNYQRILSLMNENPYEVFIYGHSCGISDRTFLTTLFEHEKCRGIKIYHRGSKDKHRQTAMNISRHFRDKFKMRERVLPYNPGALIQQVSETSVEKVLEQKQ